MNAWSLDQKASAHASDRARSLDGFMSHLIDTLGEPEFGPRLIAHMNDLIQVDFFSV